MQRTNFRLPTEHTVRAQCRQTCQMDMGSSPKEWPEKDVPFIRKMRLKFRFETIKAYFQFDTKWVKHEVFLTNTLADRETSPCFTEPCCFFLSEEQLLFLRTFSRVGVRLRDFNLHVRIVGLQRPPRMVTVNVPLGGSVLQISLTCAFCWDPTETANL